MSLLLLLILNKNAVVKNKTEKAQGLILSTIAARATMEGIKP